MFIDLEKHQKYVEFSADESPIHISEDFAKRVGFDGLVVHGTHLLEIACKEFFKKMPATRIFHLKVDFLYPIYVEEDFLIEISFDSNTASISIMSGNRPGTKIRLFHDNTEKQLSGIDIGNVSEFYKNISSVSKYVGMIDPGESAVFRRLEVFTETPPLFESHGDNIRVKDHDFEDYTIRSIAIVNRLAKLDDEIIKTGEPHQHCRGNSELAGRTFLIFGFGTLGKVIFQVLMSLGYQEGYILTGRTREADEFIKRSFLEDSSNIKVLDKSSELPASADIIFYTASPRIEIETSQNRVHLSEVYQRVYYDDFFSLIGNVHHKKVFYPSTTFIENVPDQFQEYTRIKLNTENRLKELMGFTNSQYLSLKIPPFTSRHHSILIKSQNEIGVDELSAILRIELKNWLLL